ncbi:MAG: crosslink repair DNA glycosylase YcaQ family protein [Pseudomonadota bacterium]
MVPRIDNRQARRLLLQRQGLSFSPSRKLTKDGLLELIEHLGFVQVDSISTVERAHHMILFSRNQTYRRAHLSRLLERDRLLFENWTHDASIIPTCFYPYWQCRFDRDRQRMRDRLLKWRPGVSEDDLTEVLRRIDQDGPALSRDMAQARDDIADRDEGAGPGWWNWRPSKAALEHLWRTGELAVCRREAFQKVYDLASRVIPETHRDQEISDDAFIDWACWSALDRLGFATSGELAAFWDLVTPAEAKRWCEQRVGGDLIAVEIETADGSQPRRSFMAPETLETLEDVPEPPGRVRVLSPFDPLIRDRNRTQRLFNYHYRIEVFVPAAKRRYGYYVFPLLERDRLIGRIDMKCQRDEGVLSVSGLWLEPKIKLSAGRQRALESELERLRRFTGMNQVTYEDDWFKTGG